MSMDRSRRARFATVAPTTGEYTAAALLVGAFLLFLTPVALQAIVSRVVSGEFAWPDGSLLGSYAGLVNGHFGAGLPRRIEGALPADEVMWLLTVAGEVLVLGAGALAGTRMRSLTGTSSRHGLATPAQATQALGLPRLRASAPVIRPDLHPREGPRARPH